MYKTMYKNVLKYIHFIYIHICLDFQICTYKQFTLLKHLKMIV